MTEPLRDSTAGAGGDSPSPENPTVAFERKDVHIQGIVAFGVGLAVLIGVALLVIAGYYSYLQSQARKVNSEFPVADAVRRDLRATDPGKLLPPAPRLDGIGPISPGQPAGRVIPAIEQADYSTARDYYEKQERILESWHSADKDHPNARMPIAEAIRRLANKPGDLLKARPGSKPVPSDKTVDRPSAANSGRGWTGGHE